MSRTTRYLTGLTGLRGIAALSVAIFHFKGSQPNLDLGPLDGFVDNSHLWVDLFFVLSGYVMAHSYAGQSLNVTNRYRGFVLNRFSRIYPLHFVVLLLFLCLELFKAYVASQGRPLTRDPFSEEMAPQLLLLSLFLAHSFGMSESLGWNGPSWSISAEWVAYLSFPVLRGAFSGASTLRKVVVVTGCYLGLLAMALYRGDIDYTYQAGALRGVLGFTAGIGLRQLAVGKLPALLRTRWFSVAWLGLTLALIASPFGDYAIGIMFPPLIVATAQPGSRLGDFLETRLLRRLGDASYSIYMVHLLFLIVCQLGLETVLGTKSLSGQASLLYLVVWIIALCTLSVLIYDHFERPTMSRLRKRYAHRDT